MKLCKLLILVLILVNLSNVNAMYCNPDHLVVDRNSNATFTAITELSYQNYYVTSNNEQIVINTQHNFSHITVDFYIPSIMKIDFLYEIRVSTYNIAGDSLENATFNFVLGDLTDDEIYWLLSKYKEKEDTIKDQEQQIADLENATGNYSLNNTAWANYTFPTPFMDEHGESLFMTLFTALSVGFAAILGIVKIYHDKSVQVNAARQETQNKEDDLIKARITKQAVAYSCDIYIEKEIDGEIHESRMMNSLELEAMGPYTVDYDVTPFLRPYQSQIQDSDTNEIRDMTSIDQCRYVFGQKNISVYDQFYIASALSKYLKNTGRKQRNDKEFPVGCDYDEFKEFYSQIKELKEKQDDKVYDTDKQKLDQTGVKVAKFIETKLKSAKNITPKRSDSTSLSIIDDINKRKGL